MFLRKSTRIHAPESGSGKPTLQIHAICGSEHLPSQIHKSSGSDWIRIPEHLGLPPDQFQNSTLIMSTFIKGRVGIKKPTQKNPPKKTH
jgi:hypothetical protein